MGLQIENNVLVKYHHEEGEKILDIPNYVTEIQHGAVEGCGALEEVVIPGSVQKIGEYAFSGCRGLKRIVLADGVKVLGTRAFNGCVSLEELVLPKSIQSIEPAAFGGAAAPREVKIPAIVKRVWDEAFCGCEGLRRASISEGITEIGVRTFAYCKNLNEVTIPSTVKKIDVRAFSGCGNLEEIELPDSLEEIGNFAFYACKSLRKVVLPKSLKRLGKDSFAGCTQLEEILIPDELKGLAENAFDGPAGTEEKVPGIYSHEKISERLYIVTENYSNTSRFTIGVFAGGERALVVDSGLGMCGNLRKYVEALVGTEKPMICACLDGHMDRLGAAYQFDEAFLNHADIGFVEESFNRESRLQAVRDFTGDVKELVEYAKIHGEDNSCKLTHIEDGVWMHLGSMRIETVGVPGHSKGSIAIMSRKDKAVFTGDAINKEVHLYDVDRKGFAEYREALQRFVDNVDEDINIYAGSTSIPQHMDMVRDLVANCDEILEGKVDGDIPVLTPFMDREIRMHLYHNTCIVYNAQVLQN